MIATELTCGAIVASYALLRLRAAGAERGAVAARLACLMCAAWVGEDSVIRAYGFYGYAPAWSLFVDRVPLLIVAIWPVVIDSAHVLARHLVASVRRVAIVGGLIVLADASLIEPIAVHAGLWTWSAENARSVLDVPPIGILGWGLFAAAAIATLELRERRGPRRSGPGDALVILVAPLATHLALVACWWCGLRWLGAAPSPWAPAVAAWCLAISLAPAAWRRGAEVPLAVVLARAPGALFFFALLATTARDRPYLVVYGLAFAPPYLALVVSRAKRERQSREVLAPMQ